MATVDDILALRRDIGLPADRTDILTDAQAEQIIDAPGEEGHANRVKANAAFAAHTVASSSGSDTLAATLKAQADLFWERSILDDIEGNTQRYAAAPAAPIFGNFTRELQEKLEELPAVPAHTARARQFVMELPANAGDAVWKEFIQESGLPDTSGHAAGEVLTILMGGDVDWSTIGEQQIAAAVAQYLIDNPPAGVTQQQLTAEVTRLVGLINANAANISSNDTDINTNAGRIAANLAAIATERGRVTANAAAIATNRAGIAANTAAIPPLQGGIVISPRNIPTAASIQRDFKFGWFGLPEAWLKAQGANEFEVWANGFAFHAVDPWVPTANGVIDVNVNDTEATGIDIQAGQTILSILMVVRKDGNFVADWEASLEIIELPTTDAPTQEQFNAEVALRQKGDDFNKKIITGANAAAANASLVEFLDAQANSDNTGLIEIEANGATDGTVAYDRGDMVVFPPKSKTGKIIGNTFDYSSRAMAFLFNQVGSEADLNTIADAQSDDPHGEWLRVTAGFRYSATGTTYKVDDILWLQPYMPLRAGVRLMWNVGGGAAFEFSTTDKIEFLNLRIEPGVIAYPSGGLTAALTRTTRVIIDNPGRLDEELWFEGEVDGQDVVNRTAWTTATAGINFVIPLATARQIGQNDQLVHDIKFYDAANAGNLVGTKRISLPLVKQRAVVELASRAAYDALAAKDPDTTYFVEKS